MLNQSLTLLQNRMNQPKILFIDFAKAYDSIYHKMLQEKIQKKLQKNHHIVYNEKWCNINNIPLNKEKSRILNIRKRHLKTYDMSDIKGIP